MRFFNEWNSRRRIRSAGQALILIIITFFGLMFFFGMMIDLGQIFIAKGYLRRASDAAALAAAAQIRETQDINILTIAAKEVAAINGIQDASITVQTCSLPVGNPAGELCETDPTKIPKKLVKVTVTVAYPLTFLRIFNFNFVQLTETSVSEAASMDVVLVLDVGESMAWDTTADPTLNYDEDPANPAVCNATNTCDPFLSVKNSAGEFMKRILDRTYKGGSADDEEDRVAVVTFANGWEGGSQGTQTMFGGNWVNDYYTAMDAGFGIPSLTVYDPGEICPLNDFECGATPGSACPKNVDEVPTGPCVYVGRKNSYDVYPFQGFNCARLFDIDTYDPDTTLTDKWDHKDEAISACTTTNIGGGMRFAGQQFANQKRQDALWVVVVLTDGAANASFGVEGDFPSGSGNDLVTSGFPLDPKDFVPYLPFGFCPDGTWVGRGIPGYNNRMYCQDGDVDVTHSLLTDPANYDADDFARDQARFVACNATKPSDSCNKIKGQGAVIFTIGLGKDITDFVDEDPNILERKPYGGALLRFMAALGDDGNAETDPCADILEPTGQKPFDLNCGNYFYAELDSDLNTVFEMIYSRIFTRLTM